MSHGDDRELARVALRALQCWWSEHEYAAGWLMGIEQILQGHLDLGTPVPIFRVFGILHDEAGGWWVWDDDAAEDDDGYFLSFKADE
jgi:hypothetical protein